MRDISKSSVLHVALHRGCGMLALEDPFSDFCQRLVYPLFRPQRCSMH